MSKSLIASIIPEKDLALEYNSAKIIASPYDYKISERILFDDSYHCSGKYNIYSKSSGTEEYLAYTALGLEPIKYLCADITIPTMSEHLNDIIDVISGLEVDNYMSGTLIKWNNLIVNETSLIDSFRYVTCTEGIGNAVRIMKDKSYLKALEVLFTKCTAKESLIPSLMYLLTEFRTRTLEDIENIVFAKQAIDNGKAPVVKSIYFYDGAGYTDTNEVLGTALVPLNIKGTTGFISDLNDKFTNEIKLDKLPEHKKVMHTLGLWMSFVYGCEVLYLIDNLKNTEIKEALEYLLSVNFNKDSLCGKYLYSFTDTDNLEINKIVEETFSDNPEERFNNIKAAFEVIKTLPDFNVDDSSNYNWYSMPLFFGKLIIDLHAYAYQICRVKHATLLYLEAKEKGVINKELLQDSMEYNNSIFGLGDVGSGEDDRTSELLNLEDLAAGGSSPKDDSDDMDTSKKETPPSLAAADLLKKDLHDSMYSYDIYYVKNNISYKEAYNSISKNIHLITHELTKQIKEIKTYNVGGKNSGLTSGKLDKKNLWKYKSDPHIFYNNNYKIKEMDLAFGCILDESGSMHGEKIKNGRIVMIMLHEVLTSLGINHSIIGHTSSGMYQSTIYKYYQFKEEAHYSLDKPYGLIEADNRSGNCDSGALYYMQSVLKGVRNKDKIVIIFSDGQPTECTDLDLTTQVKNMEKEGIHVIGVGINFDSIKDYYPDNANGKNLKEMVNIVISILKRYVLEKTKSD